MSSFICIKLFKAYFGTTEKKSNNLGLGQKNNLKTSLPYNLR